ncbi:methyltransferase family protein [Jannaschia sp. LMIT008]|uniref:methyltransferase family protein n=1 Tax=Jannaschia maritima TaxID=3032585 RepID=UPI002810B72F|nr:methyltransferase [Jannaschia sp. LMIT008]
MISPLLPEGLLPEPLLWALRWVLFLGPLGASAWLMAREPDPRRRVGALFAGLYGLGTIFVTHQIALAAGWWRFGGEALMLVGMPADILVGGALLFGPVLHLAAPRANPFLIAGAIVMFLHVPFFASLPPFVQPGPGWLAGVAFVFLVAHVPALWLARWTSENRKLGPRATLLAFGFGWLAFGLLPSAVMRAMGGGWGDLPTAWSVLGAAAVVLAPIQLVGLAGVQMFVLRGNGTPVPLDPTDRLVRAGIYAYVTNPMQLCTAATWVVMGLVLGNVWIALMAGMAWVFVRGMVRWHHRHDLLVRFPDGWPEYRANVPEWLPRWRPWMPVPATLTYDPSRLGPRHLAEWLDTCAIGLTLRAATGPAIYRDGDFTAQGPAAWTWALGHVNFATMLVGAGLHLMLEGVLLLRRPFARSETRHA